MGERWRRPQQPQRGVPAVRRASQNWVSNRPALRSGDVTGLASAITKSGVSCGRALEADVPERPSTSLSVGLQSADPSNFVIEPRSQKTARERPEAVSARLVKPSATWH
jgi:hypothetical protein